MTPEAEAEFLKTMIHVDRCLAVFVDGEVAAWAQVRPFGHFFGGRSVPMGGFSPVVAAPEYRGRGFGSLITAAHYPSMRERGEVVACLYPASTQLYRGVGFELGGVSAQRRLPTRSFHKLRPSGSPRIRRATADDVPAIRACYRRFAATQQGWIDRPDVWWDQRVLPAGKFDEQHLYVVDAPSGAAGELEGYIRYTHIRAKPWGYTVAVAELCATDPDVVIALWRLVGSSSTQAEFAQVAGPFEHPLLFLLADQDLTTVSEIRWMLRLIDARGAVEARGFPTAVSAEVDLDLTDRHCDWNAGRWRLSIAGGKAALQRGGSGDVALSINALSTLYAGYASAPTLRQTGLISNGSPDALDALTTAFAGPTPSMVDFF
jgi:predicted acetyltransferase